MARLRAAHARGDTATERPRPWPSRGLTAPSYPVHLFAALAGFASVFYAVMQGIGSLTGHREWSDRSPVGVALFSVIWITLAAAAISAAVDLWGAATPPLDSDSLTHDGEIVGPVTAQSSGTQARATPWRQGTALLAGLAVLATVYSGIYRAGVIVGGDWGTWPYQAQANRLFPFPSLWSFSNLGNSNLAGTSSYLLESASGLLGHLGIGYGTAERALFYMPVFFLGYFGVYFIVRRVVGGDILPVVCAVFFMGSVPVVAFFIGGWFTVLAGTVLLSWLVLAAERYLVWPSAWRAIGAGVVLGLAGWYDPRNVYLDGVGLGVYLLVLMLGRGRRQVARKLLRPATLLAPLVAIAMQLQWLIPYLAGLHTGISGQYFTAAAARTFSFNSLGDGLSAFNYAWPVMKTGLAQAIPWLWAVVPLAAAVALWTSARSMFVLFAVGAYLAYSLLAAGAEAPFGALYVQLFLLVPGVDLYRDTSPYLLPATLAATFLLGVAIRSATDPLAQSWRRLSSGGDRRGFARVLIGGVLVVAVAATTLTTFVTVRDHPQRLSGDLTAEQVPARYQDINTFLATSTAGSALWIPSTSGFALRGVADHPNISAAYIGSQLNVPTLRGALPASWAAEPLVLQLALRLYHIRYVVLRTDPSAYAGADPPSLESLGEILVNPLTRYLCALGCHRFGSLVLAEANPGAASPLTLLGTDPTPSSATSSGPPSMTRSGSDPASVLTNQCLTSTTFPESQLRSTPWQPVINGDNFAGLSLAASGVTERGQRSGAVRLTVASGAATVVQVLNNCRPLHGISMWQVQIRYRADDTAYVNIEIYHSDYETAYCSLSSSLNFVTKTCLLTLVPTKPSRYGPASIALSLLPLNNTRAPYAHATSAVIASVSVHEVREAAVAEFLRLHPASITPSVASAIPTPLLSIIQAAIDGIFHPRAQESESSPLATYRDVDSWDVLIPPARQRSQLLVLWQTYNPRWVAIDRHSGHPLPHVVVNGWANGYVLPRSSAQPILVRLYYTGQSLLEVAIVIESSILGLLCIAALGATIQLLRRHRISAGSMESHHYAHSCSPASMRSTGG